MDLELSLVLISNSDGGDPLITRSVSDEMQGAIVQIGLLLGKISNWLLLIHEVLSD